MHHDLEHIVGMSEAEASGYLIAHGYFLSLNSKDGETYIKTCELNPNRVNVDVENDIVVKFNGVG